MELHQSEHIVRTVNMNNYHHHYLPTSDNNMVNIKLVNIDIDDHSTESPLALSVDGTGDWADVDEFLSDQEETDVEEEIKKSLAGASGRSSNLVRHLSIVLNQ